LRGAGVCYIRYPIKIFILEDFLVFSVQRIGFIMRCNIIPYNPNLKDFARKLRNDSTLGEVLLWNELKNKKMYGYDFHRQKPLLNYIVDLYCYELDLVIEVDGQYHNSEEKSQSDFVRDEELSKYNLTILRFTEYEVRKDMVNILRVIETHVLEYESKQF
jgi:very-short-patch-repair endonuclease